MNVIEAKVVWDKLRDLEEKYEVLESIIISIQAHISARLKEEADARELLP